MVPIFAHLNSQPEKEHNEAPFRSMSDVSDLYEAVDSEIVKEMKKLYMNIKSQKRQSTTGQKDGYAHVFTLNNHRWNLQITRKTTFWSPKSVTFCDRLCRYKILPHLITAMLKLCTVSINEMLQLV